jgi:hypothetical protein
VSAALQLPSVAASIEATGTIIQKWRSISVVERNAVERVEPRAASQTTGPVPNISLAFYRKHTEKTLRRYMYASMLVGRAPAILGEPVGRGWVSSRKVKTFEDAVIFVLDIERCLKKLGSLDCTLLSRVALQEYTHTETAAMLGVNVRAVSYRYPLALDRLTELLLESDLLILPRS